jgi:hypothetical protein
MIGVPERENARVYDIQKHPNYRSYFEDQFHVPGIDQPVTIDMPPELMIEGDIEIPTDTVDEEMIKILEGVGAAQTLEERNAIGGNVCWLCTHRTDRRPWWKRMLFTPNESSYLCGATKRTEVADPVSGQVRWIERLRGAIGPQLALVDTPHRPCVELNPDGRCQTFNIAMAKKKKRRRKE